MTKYLEDCCVRMRMNTWRQKLFVFRSFASFLLNVDYPADAITTRQVTDFLNSRAAKAGKKAANRDLRDLKALYNWAINQELFSGRNPAKSILKFPEDPYIAYVPPAEDLAAVRLAATPDQLDFIEVIYHALARKVEATRLTWEDVNFEQRCWLRLYTRKRRGGQLEPQYKPLNKTLYNVLHARWRQRDKQTPHIFQFGPYELRRMMPNLCKKAKVKPFGFHSIRHYVASLVNDSGKATTKQIQGLLGHKRQTTTELYLHTLGDSLHAAAQILDLDQPLKGAKQ